jgi:DNA repair exonuclease SbcCD ATPase subunit
MKLISLEIQNFKSWIGKHYLDFSQGSPGVYYVGGENRVDPLGSNGAGKSSLWEAWCWCWYGRTPRNLKSAAIEPWGHETSLVQVKVCWEEHDIRYTVTRSRNPIGITLQIDDGSSGNSNNELDAQIVEQTRIDEIVGLSLTEFVHLLLMGQGVPLFFDLPSAQKLDILQDILDLSSWVDRAKAADVETKRLADKLTDHREKLAATNARIQEVSDSIVEFRKEKKEWKQDTDDAIAALLEEIRAEKETITTIQVKIKEGRVRQKKLDGVIEVSKNDLRDYEAIVEKVGNDIETVRRDTKSLTNQLVGIHDSKTMLEQLGGGVCPTCAQSVTERHVDSCVKEYVKDVKNKKNEIKQLEDRLQELLALEVKSDKKFGKLQKLVDESKEKHEEEEEGILELERNEQTLLEGIDTRRSNIKRLLDETNPWGKLLEQKTERLEELKDLQQKYEKVTRILTKKHDATKYWVKGFREVRLMLLEESLELLELEVNMALESLGLGQWAITMEVEKEKVSGGVSKGFHVMVYPSGTSKAVPWEAYSGGESQRLRLAGRMGVASLLAGRKGIAPGIEIYDEPTAGLSPEGIDSLLALLRDRAEQLQIPIYIVDHRALDLTEFAGSIFVTKDEHGSHLKEAN